MIIKTHKRIVCDFCGRDIEKKAREMHYTVHKKWLNLPYTETPGVRVEPSGVMGRQIVKRCDICQDCMNEIIKCIELKRSVNETV